MTLTTCLVLLILAADAPSPTALGYTADSKVPQRFAIDGLDEPDAVPATWNNGLPHIVSLRSSTPNKSHPVLVFNADATVVTLESAKSPGLIIETASKTQRYADGTCVFVAGDGKTHGPHLRLESHPGNLRLGFWFDINAFATWDYVATRPGRYDVELTYALDGGASDIAIQVGDKLLKANIKPTGSWWRYVTVPIGRVHVDAAGKRTITVRCLKKTAVAAMNLKAVILRPAPEEIDPPLAPNS